MEENVNLVEKAKEVIKSNTPEKIESMSRFVAALITLDVVEEGIINNESFYALMMLFYGPSELLPHDDDELMEMREDYYFFLENGLDALVSRIKARQIERVARMVFRIN